MVGFHRNLLKLNLNNFYLGDIQHSKKFVWSLRPHIAAELKILCCKFLNSHLIQTGFLPPVALTGDCGTYKHHTRQFVGIFTFTVTRQAEDKQIFLGVNCVVPDSNSIINTISIGQDIMDGKTGVKIANALIGSLEQFGIIGDQLSSSAFDGAYFTTNVPDYLQKHYGKSEDEFPAHWDWMHKLGLIDKHISKSKEFSWLADLCELCSTLYCKFDAGNYHERLVKAARENHCPMQALTNFSTTRFANSKRLVFRNILVMLEPIFHVLEDDIMRGYENRGGCQQANQTIRTNEASAKSLRGLSRNKYFILLLSGLTDLYNLFGIMVNICQSYRLLPHNRLEKLDKEVNRLKEIGKMFDNVSCSCTDHPSENAVTRHAEDKHRRTLSSSVRSADAEDEEHPDGSERHEVNVDDDDNDTTGSYLDKAGNKIWICPACGKKDDGSPMIGCDQCDDWYHWPCVGIRSEPPEDQDWFCTRCMARKPAKDNPDVEKDLRKTVTRHAKDKQSERAGGARLSAEAEEEAEDDEMEEEADESNRPKKAVTRHAKDKQCERAGGARFLVEEDKDDVDDDMEKVADESDKLQKTVTRHAEDKQCEQVAADGLFDYWEDEEEEEETPHTASSSCPLKYFHQAMKSLKDDNSYQNVLIPDDYPIHSANLQSQTRSSQTLEKERRSSNVEQDILQKLKKFCLTLASRIEEEAVSLDERNLINTTKVLLDFNALSPDTQKINNLSPTTFAHVMFPKFQKAVDTLKIPSLNLIDKTTLDIQFKRFITKLWDMNSVENKPGEEILRKFLSSKEKLYEDIEVIVHVLVSAATKSSCESVVESYVR